MSNTNTTTATNTSRIARRIGKANTHVIHLSDNGRHANCNYNGNGRELRNFSELAPGASVTGQLCGKCFKHFEITNA